MVKIGSRLLSFSALALAAASPAQWTVTILNADGFAYAKALDGDRQYGEWGNGGLGLATSWQGSPASQLSLHPPGWTSSIVHGASPTAQVGSIYSEDPWERHACLWNGTAASMIDLSPPGARWSEAFAVYGGQQVGYVESVINYRENAALWSGTAASWVNLHPAGASRSFARDLNDAMQVGYTHFGLYPKAGYWTGTAASWTLLPSGNGQSQALAVEGTTIGGINSAHATLWLGPNHTMVDLHPPITPPYMAMSRINDLSGPVQVGIAQPYQEYDKAAVWAGTVESYLSLHALLPPNCELSRAWAVKSDGVNFRCVGEASFSDIGTKAVMWSGPIPNPNFELSLNKTTIAGENSVQGTIIRAQARPWDTAFQISDNSSLVTTPPSVTVAKGSLTKAFQIRVTAITSTINTMVYAKAGTLVRSQPLTLTPLVPTAVVFEPNPVTGGSPTNCRVVINGVAGPNGRVISTFDNSPSAATPSSVTVPSGGTDVTFPIPTLAVTATKVVTVTARVSAGEKTGILRINP